MRVLLATESFLPYLSGVTVSVDALARGLGERGHEVLVLAPRPARDVPVGDSGSPGPAPRYAWLESYQLPRIAPPSYRMPWPDPWAAGLGDARDFAPEIVHAHSPFVTGVMARSLSRAVAAPLIFTHHTRFADYSHYLGPLSWLGSRVTDAYLRAYWLGCSAIIAPSRDLASEIRRRMPATYGDRVHVVPTGVDVAAVATLEPVDPRPVAGWPADSVVLASLGRLAEEKSPMTVLDAVAEAARLVPDMRLLVIGGGPAASELRRRAESPDLAGRVWFTGALPRGEALARLAGADIFAFASRTETQGLVLAEALAAGLPCVALDGPGVGDSVRDGVDGAIVAPDPAESRAARLGSVLARVASTPAQRQRLASGARDGASRFSLERRVAEVEELYRSVRRGG